MDIAMVVLTLVFLAASVLLISGFERLRGA